MKHTFQIIPYLAKHRSQLLAVWENCVLATHHFLRPADFEEIKQLVNAIDFDALQVFCLSNRGTIAGFIGIAEQKIEMLFLDPKFFRKGLGEKLLKYAIHEVGANKVDVNEQNTNALAFYQKFGFQVAKRKPLDDQGRPYPILQMNLQIGK